MIVKGRIQTKSPRKHIPRLKRKKPGSRKWVISPVKDVRPGDTIEWRATGSAIAIWFPPGNDPLKIGQRRIGKGKKFVKRIPKNLRKTGDYPYSVYCYETGEMAESNSTPYIRLA
jgi:hypothetical protein